LEKTAQNRPIVQNSAEPVMAAIIKCVNISIPEKYYESSLTESSPTNQTRAGSLARKQTRLGIFAAQLSIK
jgi:hypothetical protein